MAKLNDRLRAKIKALWTGDPSYKEFIELLDRLLDLDEQMTMSQEDGRITSSSPIRVELSSNVYVNIAVTGIEIVSKGGVDRKIKLIPNTTGVEITDGSDVPIASITSAGLISAVTGNIVADAGYIEGASKDPAYHDVTTSDTILNFGIKSGQTIHVDASAGDVHIDLPAVADEYADFFYEFIRVDGSGNVCDVVPQGSDNINGANAAINLVQYSRYKCSFDDTNNSWIMTEAVVAP